jgi:hypothetical protein
MYGSDQAASLEKPGMIALTNSIKTIIEGYGEPKVGYIFPEEEPISKKLRAHIKLT